MGRVFKARDEKTGDIVAVKVLAEGGRNADSHINRLYGYVDRMPVFGISFLADAMIASGKKDTRLEDLFRRMRNSILPEGGSAHVEELSDPYLLWFWNSNVRSTAIVLGTFVRHGEDEELVKRMVRWLMTVREEGRWGNTQENAWAMGSLVDYYRRYESQVPDFTAVVRVADETVLRDEFRGRSTEVTSRALPVPSGPTVPVTFERDGAGNLFYMLQLRYASLERNLAAVNNGFSVERSYEPAAPFEAGDLPHAAGVSVGHVQATRPGHVKHRLRRMRERAIAVAGEAEPRVLRGQDRPREDVAGRMAEDQDPPRVVRGSCQESLVVRVAAHHPVKDDDVGRLHLLGADRDVQLPTVHPVGHARRSR